MVNLKSVPLKVDARVDEYVAYDDSCIINWLETLAGTKRRDLDIVSNFDHLVDKAKTTLTYQVKCKHLFNSYFECCNRFSDVSMYELYHMFYLVGGVIVQPLHVNYHGAEHAIEASILKDLNIRGAKADEDDWNFNLVLLRFRELPVEHQTLPLDGNELHVHNTSTRQALDHLVCEFVPIEDYPWDIAKQNMTQMVQDNSLEMPKSDMEKRLATDNILPYKTVTKVENGTTYCYCWGVNEGLQRASAITGILHQAKHHDVGQLKVNVRTFALKKSSNKLPQFELLTSCSQFSKETALNNRVISQPCLCSDLTSVIVSSYDSMKPIDCPIFAKTFDITMTIIDKMGHFMNHYQEFCYDMETKLRKLPPNAITKFWSDIFKSCEPTKKNLLLIYSRKDKMRKQLCDKQPKYLLVLLFGMFICFHRDKNFLLVVSHLSDIITEETAVIMVSAALQFVNTYLPFSIRHRSEHRLRCILYLYQLAIRDIVMTLDSFFGSNAEKWHSNQELVNILNRLFSYTSNAHSMPTSDIDDRSAKSSDNDEADDERLGISSKQSSFNDDEVNSEIPWKSCRKDGDVAANLIPVNGSLVDIFLHKFLVHNLSLDSARIKSCFERGKKEYEKKYGRAKSTQKIDNSAYINSAAESFPSLQFPYLMTNVVNTSEAKCVDKCEEYAGDTPYGTFATLLQDHCLVELSEEKVRAKFPLTFKEYARQLLSGDTSQNLFLRHSLYWIPLHLFYPFNVPVQKNVIHVHTCNTMSGICALNNLFGEACTSHQGRPSEKNKLCNLGMSLPVYFSEIEIPHVYQDAFDMDDEYETGICSMPAVKYVLEEKFNCQVVAIDKYQLGGGGERMLSDNRFTGVIAYKRQLTGGPRHYFSFRKVPGAHNLFMVIDSYEDTYIPICRYEDLALILESYSLFAVLKNVEGQLRNYYKLNENYNIITKKDGPLSNPFGKFVEAHGIQTLYTAESGFALTELPREEAHALFWRADNSDEILGMTIGEAPPSQKGESYLLESCSRLISFGKTSPFLTGISNLIQNDARQKEKDNLMEEEIVKGKENEYGLVEENHLDMGTNVQENSNDNVVVEEIDGSKVVVEEARCDDEGEEEEKDHVSKETFGNDGVIEGRHIKDKTNGEAKGNNKVILEEGDGDEEDAENEEMVKDVEEDEEKDSDPGRTDHLVPDLSKKRKKRKGVRKRNTKGRKIKRGRMEEKASESSDITGKEDRNLSRSSEDDDVEIVDVKSYTSIKTCWQKIKVICKGDGKACQDVAQELEAILSKYMKK